MREITRSQILTWDKGGLIFRTFRKASVCFFENQVGAQKNLIIVHFSSEHYYVDIIFQKKIALQLTPSSSIYRYRRREGVEDSRGEVEHEEYTEHVRVQKPSGQVYYTRYVLF